MVNQEVTVIAATIAATARSGDGAVVVVWVTMVDARSRACVCAARGGAMVDLADG